MVGQGHVKIGLEVVLVGTVVLVMTDVQGSSRLWHEEQAAMDAAMRRHHEIVHGAVLAHGGRLPVDQGEGDAVFAAFDSPVAAVAAVVELQRGLAAGVCPTSRPLRVRVGVHVGEVIERAGNLFGDPVNRCARVRALGSGGQTLLTAPVFELVRDLLPAGVSVRDLGEHRMKDLTRPERVFQLDVDGLPGEFPPLLSLDRARHNLPVQLSSFVGRDDDVAAVRQLVEAHRLVTITGFGGMGKTRLALQVAAGLADGDGDGDGVWFVDLSATTDPARVAPAIAAVLGITESGDGPAVAVQRGLVDKRLLLVLDNLEQLLDSAGFIADLLAAAPQVRILGTSREVLHVPGEHEFVLAPLAIAGPDTVGGDVDVLSSYPAVRLFIDRAVAACHDFAITIDSAPVVAAICARLEGHPLSIELAAARTKVLDPDALLARLDSALSVLTGGSQGRAERYQTLRATIAWSYDGLPAPEQLLLDALSVFAGSATLAAIEAICGPSVSMDLDVLDGVTALVDKSLLRVIEASPTDPETRFALLVSVRDYAAERLAARGLTLDVARRHADYYRVLGRLPDDWVTEQEDAITQAAIRDLPNLHSALAFLHTHGSPADEAACVRDMAYALSERGHLQDVITLAERALARHPEPSVETAGLHYELSVSLDYNGKSEAARLHLQQMLAIAREIGRPDILAKAAISMVWEAQTATELAELVDEADTALNAVPETGNNPPRDWLLLFRGHAVHSAMRYADPDRARATAEDLLSSAHSGKDQLDERLVATSLMDRGDYTGAGHFLRPLEPRLPNIDQISWLEGLWIRIVLAQMYLGLGDAPRALYLAREAVRRAEERDAIVFTTEAYLVLAECLYHEGDLHAAIEALQRANASSGQGDDPAEIGCVEWRLARAQRQNDDPAGNVELLTAAWTRLAGHELHYLPDVLGCLVERAIHTASHDPESAAHLLGLVKTHRRGFVLPLAVADETAPLLAQLRDRVGSETIDRLLTQAATEPLPRHFG